MDYLQTYNDAYHKNYELFKKLAFESLESSKEMTRIFKDAFKLSIFKASQKWHDDSSWEFFDSNSSYELLGKDRRYELDNTKKVLENDLKERFENLEIKRKKMFVDYSDYLQKTAKKVAIENVIELLETSKKVINTLYTIDRLDSFNFSTEFDYENKIDGYTSAYESLFPNEKRASESIDTDILSKNEKYLLLHILFSFFEESKKPTMVEIAKIITLANVDDEILLTDKYKNHDGYRILLYGYKFRAKKEIQREWIKSLLEKIKPYKLAQTSTKLRMELRKLN
ncbi:hypothetical protein [Cellulophaga sp. E6(2014)]|uniref:hypothetical protein n=1 Tax=Cellulophaga sp. E6(2014) TaxID=1495334 RepID=UPI00051D2C20|nr:hypothetical protein [Cellulophaga sp. E6(2014)]KGK29975.1 hypothetical protein EL45_12280 [Cellulophaga sp. E6(2014)]